MLARIRAARLVPTAVGVLVAITVTLTWVTVLHPVLEHDDWDMLLPDGSPFVLDHASRVLHEGRWLNYWWWRLGSQHLGSHVVTLCFWLGWSLATATLTRLLARDWWAVPIAVAVFASPMITQISYWPATLMLAMLVLAAAGIALTATRSRPRLHLALLGVAVLALALGYPPFALLLLPLLAVLHREASWRRLALVGGTLAAGYVGAILLVYVLNDIRFGVFGMEIQAWRAPHPVHGPRSLAHNLVMVLHDNLQVARFTVLPLLAVAVCVVLALRAGADRRWPVLAAAFVLAWGLSGATTVVNGVGLPIRSVSWTWPFGVIAIAWTLRTGPRSTRLIAGLALIAFAAWGALYAATQVRAHQRFESAMDHIRARAVTLSERGQRPIVLVPRTTYAENSVDLQTAQQFGNGLQQRTGIEVAGVCTDCAPLVRYARHRAPHASVILGPQGQVLVRFPAALVDTPLNDHRPPWWLSPLFFRADD